MTRYSVRYELDAQPSNVIVEIICRDKEDAKQVYNDRIYQKLVRIIETDLKSKKS